MKSRISSFYQAANNIDLEFVLLLIDRCTWQLPGHLVELFAIDHKLTC